MKKTFLKWISLFCLGFVLLCQSGCAQMELDLTVNRDGSGKASIQLSSPDTLMNAEFTNAIRKLREDLKKQGIQAKITETSKNNLKQAKIEISSNSIARDGGKISGVIGIKVSHQVDGKIHRVVINEYDGMLTKLSIKMPGKIIDTNGKTSGSIVRWDIEPYSFSMGDGSFWVESEVSGIGGSSNSAGSGSPFLLLGIIALVLGVALLFLKKKRPLTEASDMNVCIQGKFCSECGNAMSASEQFCSECGARRE